jgi:hypothetical protein
MHYKVSGSEGRVGLYHHLQDGLRVDAAWTLLSKSY